MVIGFDASRAFANWRTGTENYSYQLLKALKKIDEKQTKDGERGKGNASQKQPLWLSSEFGQRKYCFSVHHLG